MTLDKLPISKPTVDQILSEVFGINSNYKNRKKLYSKLQKKGEIKATKKYRGTLEQNILLINYAKKIAKKQNTQETRDKFNLLVEEIITTTPAPKIKNPKLKEYKKRIQLTLNVAKRKTNTEQLNKIKKALETLFLTHKNGEISSIKFDKECTKIRKTMMIEFEKQRIKNFEKMKIKFQTMSGEEFSKLYKKYGGGSKFRKLMGIKKPKKTGVFKKDDNFLNKEILNSKKTYKELIQEVSREAIKEFKIIASLKTIENLAIAIIYHESKGDPLAISKSYSLGISQLGSDMFRGGKNKAKFNQTPVNPFNPNEAIPRSIKFICYLYKKYKGNKKLILQAYNAGENDVDKAQKKDKKNYTKYLSNESRKYPEATKRDYQHLKTNKPNLQLPSFDNF